MDILNFTLFAKATIIRPISIIQAHDIPFWTSTPNIYPVTHAIVFYRKGNASLNWLKYAMCHLHTSYLLLIQQISIFYRDLCWYMIHLFNFRCYSSALLLCQVEDHKMNGIDWYHGILSYTIIYRTQKHHSTKPMPEIHILYTNAVHFL